MVIENEMLIRRVRERAGTQCNGGAAACRTVALRKWPQQALTLGIHLAPDRLGWAGFDDRA